MIGECDRYKTPFTSHHGLFQFVRIAFSQKNAPATYQREMDVILLSLKWWSPLIFLNDSGVFLKNTYVNMAHLGQVLALPRDAGVTLKLSKCSLFAKKTNYVGHVIRTRWLKPFEATTALVRKLKDPTTRTGLRSISALCRVFCWLVQIFSGVALPMNRKLRKDQPATIPFLNRTETDVVENLKTLLMNSPVLAISHANGQYTVDLDTRDTQVVCVLL